MSNYYDAGNYKYLDTNSLFNIHPGSQSRYTVLELITDRAA